MLRKPGSFTSGESDAVRVVGPSAPATKRGLSGFLASQVSAASRASFAAATFNSAHEVLHVVVGHGHRVRAEGVGLDDVRPSREIGLVDLTDDGRLGQDQQVVVPLEILGEVGEALAAIVGLRELVALDHGAHAAVQDEDAALEKGFEAVRGVSMHGLADLAARSRKGRIGGRIVPNPRSAAHGGPLRREPPRRRDGRRSRLSECLYQPAPPCGVANIAVAYGTAPGPESPAEAKDDHEANRMKSLLRALFND